MHSIRVARRIQRMLSGTVYREQPAWLAVVLMHGGKASSRPSLAERALATLASPVVTVATARRSASAACGTKRRIGSYLIHSEIGAEWIRGSGGRREFPNGRAFTRTMPSRRNRIFRTSSSRR